MPRQSRNERLQVLLEKRKEEQDKFGFDPWQIQWKTSNKAVLRKDD
jgi:hypothetical protein